MGSVIALKNAKGEVVNRYSYDVWGDLIASEEQVPNAIRYRGEYQDAETGFYYLRGRYYDPATRKFTTLDPAEDGLNWNIYCEGNPIDYVDPSGYLRVALSREGADLGHQYSEIITIYYIDRHITELMNRGKSLAPLFDWTWEIAQSFAQRVWIEVAGILQSVINVFTIKSQLAEAKIRRLATEAVASIDKTDMLMKKGVKLTTYIAFDDDGDGSEVSIESELVDRAEIYAYDTPFYIGAQVEK